MTVKNDWANQGRFEGWLDFDINQAFEGWIMKIHFSKPVTQINVGYPPPTHPTPSPTPYSPLYLSF